MDGGDVGQTRAALQAHKWLHMILAVSETLTFPPKAFVPAPSQLFWYCIHIGLVDKFMRFLIIIFMCYSVRGQEVDRKDSLGQVVTLNVCVNLCVCGVLLLLGDTRHL